MKQVIFALVACIFMTGCMTTIKRTADGRCANEDFKSTVSGGQDCLYMSLEEPTAPSSEPPTLIVTFHGDHKNHKLWKFIFGEARKVYPSMNTKNFYVAHFDRPGWANSSGDSDKHGMHTYTKRNVTAVMEAINRLKKQLGAKKLIAFGHSGGANTLAIGMGMYPELAPDSALLTACACELHKWTTSNGWQSSKSINPYIYADKIPSTSKVILMTGEGDSNTKPRFAKNWVMKAQSANKDAQFILARNAGHINIRNSDDFKREFGIFLNVN